MIIMYRLEGHTPVPVEEDDLLSVKYPSADERRVALDNAEYKGHKIMVSTVFLGVDHSFSDDGPPILFETMVFCDDDYSGLNEYTERYETWEQAEEGHARIVEMVAKEFPLIIDGIDKQP